MKGFTLLAAALAFLISAGSAQAADSSKSATHQQNRMKSCAAQYHQKHIAKAQYHSFMSSCLKTSKASKAAK